MDFQHTKEQETVTNIGENIKSKLNANLHKDPRNPICILKNKIYEFFGAEFHKFDDLDSLVSVEDNFDKLLVPEDHPSRAMTDTYYWTKDTVLRTHTTAHQNYLLEEGYEAFLITGDVYRKDTVDRFHSPVFYQIEGCKIVNDDEDPLNALKNKMVDLIEYLFPGCDYVIEQHEFPFTYPSFEVEVKYNGEWVEVLGCGVVKNEILENCGLAGKKAYAFGLGLERLAMILFDIPDIRYFWSNDERFFKQFESGEIVQFKEYSDYPPVYKDISFWYDKNTYNELDLYEVVREIAGELIEDIEEFDDFTHPKTGKTSKGYRLTFRHPDRSMTDEEVNELNERIRNKVNDELDVEIRKN